MKKGYFLYILLLFCLTGNVACSQSNDLKLVFIRHAEKPSNGDNLNCQGLNRSMLLPAVLMKKFGKPNNIYVPTPTAGKDTRRARMLQTITPFAAKYNLNINSAYGVDDYRNVGKALLNEHGTVIIVWQHTSISAIVKSLGVKSRSLGWADDDFDSIWIVTFPNGTPMLTKDKEGIVPPAGCPF